MLLPNNMHKHCIDVSPKLYISLATCISNSVGSEPAAFTILLEAIVYSLRLLSLPSKENSVEVVRLDGRRDGSERGTRETEQAMGESIDR